jgi:hypothetical protein
METARIDYYPDETKSFKELPNDSPIQYLDYGGILTNIGEQVAKKRKENRNNRMKFLITKINNTNMGILINSVIIDARKMNNFTPKKWYKGKKTKSGFLEFFKNTDISLKYLEDLYEYQNKGPPKFNGGDIFRVYNTYECNYGMIHSVIGKTVKYYMLKDDNIKTNVDDFHNVTGKLTYYFSRNGHTDLSIRSTNIWNCKNTNFNSEEITLIFNNLMKDYNLKMDELEKRKKFLKSNSILLDMQIPYDFYNYDIDIFDGQLPSLAVWKGPVYINSWTIIHDIITNA